MKKITVNLDKCYDIIIESSCIHNLHKYIENLSFAKKAQKVVIISDNNVSAVYGKIVADNFKKLGYTVKSYCFSAGEQSKNLFTVKDIYSFLYDFNITRSDFIVALGGGVAGDITGFVAATYLRGVPFIQIPTSLLAQIDSSVGGKTGVDLEKGKNLVGSFYQPKCVIIDPLVLQTLPQKFIKDGLGEAIKYGCIADRKLFDLLRDCDPKNSICDVIERCLIIKKHFVEKDEKDTGDRMLLNFGHTLGHAIEVLYNFSGYTHGEAVCVGMVLITEACVKNGVLLSDDAKEIHDLIVQYSLPTKVDFAMDNIIDIALSDKKRMGNDINLILLEKIGKAFIKRMSKENFRIFMMKDGF